MHRPLRQRERRVDRLGRNIQGVLAPVYTAGSSEFEEIGRQDLVLVVAIESGFRAPQRFFEAAQLIVLVGGQHWDHSMLQENVFATLAGARVSSDR